jgi:hypothetical protein
MGRLQEVIDSSFAAQPKIAFEQKTGAPRNDYGNH